MRTDITVLATIDQNVYNNGKQTGKGAWKWRARQTGKRGGTVLVEPEGLKGDRDSPKGKRRLTLQDDDALDKENNLSEKKLKIGQLMEIESPNMVEVAGQ